MRELLGHSKRMSDFRHDGGAAAADKHLEMEALLRASLGQYEAKARLAAARFAVATLPNDDHLPPSVTAPAVESTAPHTTASLPRGRIVQVAASAGPRQGTSTTPRTDVVTAVIPDLLPASIPAHDDAELRLPATWYAKPKKPAVTTFGLSSQQHAHLIRAVAAACLTTAAALLIWLSTMPPSAQNLAQPAQSPSLLSGFAPGLTSGFAALRAPVVPDQRPAHEPPSQDQISTAQILAVAERFVAMGDILAARAMLQERAGSGEPRALFALAETYDPHMLSSWAARDAEPSITYARFLYDAARRGGITDAQIRIDALK